MPLLALLTLVALLLSAAPANAMPKGAVTVSGKRADCLGGRGAPCAGNVRGLMAPVAGTFTRDGRHFYVGSIAMGGLISLQRDPATGRLARIASGIACIGYQQGCDRVAHPMPTDLELTHDERFVLAAGSRSEGLLGFARDPATGALTPAGCLQDAREGRCWYVHGTGEVDQIELTPDDRFAIVSSTDGLGVVARDLQSGALSQAPDACIASDDYGDHQDDCRSDASIGRPLNMDLSPDGRTLYVAAEDAGGLLAFGVDPATGALSGPSRAGDREGYMEVAVSPDGRNVYAVGHEWDVHAFTRDPATGALTRIPGKRGCLGMGKGCAFLQGVFDPEDIRIPADGRHVYLAASGGVSVLHRDRDGGLRQLPGKAGCLMTKDGEVVPVIDGRRRCHVGRYESTNLTGLEIAPGGRHLYALQANTDGTYGTGIVQLMQRR